LVGGKAPIPILQINKPGQTTFKVPLDLIKALFLFPTFLVLGLKGGPWIY